jgi:hypothetical protein
MRYQLIGHFTVGGQPDDRLLDMCAQTGNQVRARRGQERLWSFLCCCEQFSIGGQLL